MGKQTKEVADQAGEGRSLGNIRSAQRGTYQTGDKISLIIGVVLTLLTLLFFTWKLVDKLAQDRAVKPVPTSTPTPPLKPLEK